jgi:Co/Zn/Cd efflux system component
MKNTTKIGIVLALTFAFFGAEITGKDSSNTKSSQAHLQVAIPVGFKTKSLALIADSVRRLTGQLGLLACRLTSILVPLLKRECRRMVFGSKLRTDAVN